jgi:hypothetical protein
MEKKYRVKKTRRLWQKDAAGLYYYSDRKEKSLKQQTATKSYEVDSWQKQFNLGQGKRRKKI